MRYVRDYWHYSAPHIYPAWAMVTEKDVDTSKTPATKLTTVVYYEGLPEHGALLAESASVTKPDGYFRLEGYAAEVERGCRERGIPFDSLEYDRFIWHLVEILNDGRRPSESEAY